MTQIKAMDALATYGKQAIDPITEIINSAGIDNQVKEHGLKVIEDIKKKIKLIDVTLIRSNCNTPSCG